MSSLISRGLFGLALLIAATIFAPVNAQIVNSQTQVFRSVVVASGLEHPWSLAFLPDGRMLITERRGRLRLIADERLQTEPVSGVPRVFAKGQGGLLDVVLHPDYASNGWIYLSFAAPGRRGAHTAVVRARLDGNRLVDLKSIFDANNTLTMPADGGKLAKVLSWYDNEWGYSVRTVDLIERVAKL